MGDEPSRNADSSNGIAKYYLGTIRHPTATTYVAEIYRVTGATLTRTTAVSIVPTPT